MEDGGSEEGEDEDGVKIVAAPKKLLGKIEKAWRLH